MKTLGHLFENNKQWADKVRAEDPEFFEMLSNQQSPEYFWIGCSDSRVPANEIIGLPPGEVFVHRNIANMVVHTDINCLSVLQYAVDVLKVKHIIVCGHHDCGGVKGAMSDRTNGLVDNWLHHIRDVYRKHAALLDAIEDEKERTEKLVEINVIEQVANVCHTSIVQDAWRRGQKVTVHGWIYALNNGLLKDLHVCVRDTDELAALYRTALPNEFGEK